MKKTYLPIAFLDPTKFEDERMSHMTTAFDSVSVHEDAQIAYVPKEMYDDMEKELNKRINGQADLIQEERDRTQTVWSVIERTLQEMLKYDPDKGMVKVMPLQALKEVHAMARKLLKLTEDGIL